MSPIVASKARYPNSISSINLIYRFYFLYLDPIFALGGTYLIITDPIRFLTGTIPRPLDPYIPPTLSPLTSLLLTNIAALYVYIALSMAIVLRVTSEVKVWTGVIATMVMSDAGHLFALWQASPERMLEVGKWAFDERINVGILALGLGLRLAFLLGIGNGR